MLLALLSKTIFNNTSSDIMFCLLFSEVLRFIWITKSAPVCRCDLNRFSALGYARIWAARNSTTHHSTRYVGTFRDKLRELAIRPSSYDAAATFSAKLS